MTCENHVDDGTEREIAGIVLSIAGEHNLCRTFIHTGCCSRAAESLRKARALVGELLAIVDFRNAEHRFIVADVGTEDTRCTRLVCSTRCIQAEEALIQDRALQENRMMTRECQATPGTVLRVVNERRRGLGRAEENCPEQHT